MQGLFFRLSSSGFAERAGQETRPDKKGRRETRKGDRGNRLIGGWVFCVLFASVCFGNFQSAIHSVHATVGGSLLFSGNSVGSGKEVADRIWQVFCMPAGHCRTVCSHFFF